MRNCATLVFASIFGDVVCSDELPLNAKIAAMKSNSWLKLNPPREPVGSAVRTKMDVRSAQRILPSYAPAQRLLRPKFERQLLSVAQNSDRNVIASFL